MEKDPKILKNNTVEIYWVKNNGKFIFLKPYTFQLPREYRNVVQVGTIVHPNRDLQKQFPKDIAVVTKMYHTEKPSQTYKSIKFISDTNLNDYLDWQEELNNITPKEHKETLNVYKNILNDQN